MFLNFDIIKEEGLNLDEVCFLALVKQNTSGKKEEEINFYWDNKTVDRLEHLGLIEYRKGKTSHSHRVMLSKRGKKLCIDLVQESFGKDEEVIIDWVISTFKSKGGIVTNRKESLRRLKWFSNITGLEKNELAALIKNFMENMFEHTDKKEDFWTAFKKEQENNPNLVMAQKVDNLFYKPEGIYDTKPSSYDIAKSPLYKFWKTYK